MDAQLPPQQQSSDTETTISNLQSDYRVIGWPLGEGRDRAPEPYGAWRIFQMKQSIAELQAHAAKVAVDCTLELLNEALTVSAARVGNEKRSREGVDEAASDVGFKMNVRIQKLLLPKMAKVAATVLSQTEAPMIVTMLREMQFAAEGSSPSS